MPSENKKIKILVVAPYEGLKALFESVVAERNDVAADIYVASLAGAVDLVRSININDYDAILSRGVTGELIEAVANDIPIIQLDFSGYDIIRVMHLAASLDQFAFVGHKHLTSYIKLYCDLTQTKADIYTITDELSADATIRQLNQKGCQFIIGDGVAVDIAKALGLRSILITSGKESINTAINDCIRVCGFIRNSKYKKNLINTVINNSPTGVYVFTASGSAVYSNTPVSLNLPAGFSDDLRRKIKTILQKQDMVFFDRSENINYRIIGKSLYYNDEQFIVFYVERHLKLPAIQCYSYTDFDPVRLNENLALYNSSTIMQTVLDNVKKCINHTLPILIYGEPGTGKNTLAYIIYALGRHNNRPMITINCEHSSQADWNALIDSESSILLDNENTVYFHHINMLPLSLQQTVYNFICQTSFCSRNNVISSLSGNPTDLVKNGVLSYNLYHVLNGISLYTPPLRDRIDEIKMISTCYINEINQQYATQVIGFQEDAFGLLKNYPWVFNIDQFQNVVRELTISSSTPYITAEAVEEVLNRQSTQEQPMQTNFDTGGTLVEIESRIIKAVLKEENMNQTKAAKRLGISRSTMRRKLNEMNIPLI